MRARLAAAAGLGMLFAAPLGLWTPRDVDETPPPERLLSERPSFMTTEITIENDIFGTTRTTVTGRFDARLVATLASSSEALASAWIEQRGDTRGYGIGDALGPGVEVLAISPGEVVLDLGNKLAILHLGEAPAAASAPVRRDELLQAVSSPTGADRRVRARPHTGDDGEPDGFRLVVPSGSTPASLGLRTGDVVHAVNGLPVRTMDEVVDAYGQLDDEELIEVELTRDGSPLVLTLDVF